jgi:hypothetical protein
MGHFRFCKLEIDQLGGCCIDPEEDKERLQALEKRLHFDDLKSS